MRRRIWRAIWTTVLVGFVSSLILVAGGAKGAAIAMPVGLASALHMVSFLLFANGEPESRQRDEPGGPTSNIDR